MEAILELTQDVVRNVIAPDAERIDQGHWPEPGLRALQGAGLGGLVIPREYGGLGKSLLALTRVCELIGRECASTALCFGMHCVASAVIAAKAKEEQRELLEAISRGNHLTTLALSESGTGAHFYYPQTTLLAESDGWYLVQGKKAFVTNEGHADSYVVSTVADDPKALPNMFSCVVIPRYTEGIVWGPPWEGLGMRGNASRSVEWCQVRIPRINLLGKEGDEIWYVFHVVAPYFLMAMAGTYLGIGAAAVEKAQQHLSTRHYSHSCKSLAQAAVLQHRFGSLWGTVERTRRMVYYAAEECDVRGPDALPAVCFAKADVAHCVVTVVNEAMTLGGGLAYQKKSTFDRLLRDSRASHVMAPTTDILLLWAGRALLGEPILGE